MSGNKYLLADKNKLLQKKLENLTQSLSGGLGNDSLQTQEQYIFEANKALGEFYKSLNEPELSEETIKEIRVDDNPDPDLYNLVWTQIINDLTSLFTELENVEDLTLANFNFITTETNRLTSRLKSIDSKLGDYILYSLSTSKNVLFFKDSFNDLSKIDNNSNLINSTQCEISQAEGIVTLPVNQSTDSLIIVKENPSINPSSSGVLGNNQELGKTYNGNLSVLLDNNPDTWVEYEKVVQVSLDDKEPLTLDLTMNLGEEKIVNHIRVNPNNFGTKTVIVIEDIKTSIDGQIYTSIKDDIPTAGFSSQDEENIFSLAPSTSKFSGQGLYTFTPRNIKYINFIFKQTEPYVIETSSGEKLRYAIGIRDINVRGYEYNSTGEIISQAFDSDVEIKKIAIEVNQNPTELSELARIQYYVSPDGGGSWHEVQPIKFQGPSGEFSVPEILDFNTGDSNEISTPVPVKSIRLKTVFSRSDEAFIEGSSSLNKKIITKSELSTVPQTAPFTIDLEEPPVDGTVVVIDPLFGSRGLPESQYILGHSVDRIDNRKYRLPFANLPRPLKKVSNNGTPVPTWHLEPMSATEWLHVEVGGEEWSHATQSLSNYTIDFNNLQNFKVFVFDYNSGVIEFGDSLSTTLAPADNQPISIYFEAERLFPSEPEDNHSAKLDFTTSSNKNDMAIKRYDLITYVTETVPRKAMILRLSNKNIVDYTGITSSLLSEGYDSSPKVFLNGRDELTTSTSWSIDIVEGIVYTGSPTSSTQDISVRYSYQPIIELTTSDWEWTSESLLRDSVSLKESKWATLSIKSESLPSTTNVNVLDVENLSLVKGTMTFKLQISGTDIGTDDILFPFVKEVDFINGVEELGGSFLVTKETISNSIVPVSNVGSFDLLENISTKTGEHLVSFSNATLFASLVGNAGLVVAPGDYFVDRVALSGTYGKVYFYTTTTQSNPGSVSYYYASPTFSSNGLFSVDYRLGRIYSQRVINENNEAAADYLLTVDYEYTDYRAEYKIARLLEEDSYTVDITNRNVTLQDKEILKHFQIPHAGLDSRLPMYLINYDFVSETRENIESLKEYFSPVLKDYSLRVITKGNIL